MDSQMTDEDKASASRGLRMPTLTSAALQDLIEHHMGVDMFASQVIVKAARQELIERGVQNA